ncbi:MAG: TrkA family potassium uptake protein [Chloroflexi bacterium]|nr:TrkA family potassium uptake protein [Chloroflexota bacterium]
MKKQVCVVGMGRFGASVARELYQSGHDVLAIDNEESKIQDMLGQVTYAVRADATNESVLRELGVSDFDVAIVALGSENIQSSILITVLLKSLSIPFIIARAANELHGNTLERIGADKVVYPEMESARRVAHIDFNAGILDHMEIAPGSGISKIHPPEEMLRHTLDEVGLGGPQSKYGLVVLAIRRGRSYILNPSKDEDIKPGDLLIVAGRNDQVSRLYSAAKDLSPATVGAKGNTR